MARGLHHLINLVEIDHFYFLSHSWGSFISLYYLTEFPDRVLGTILIDGGYQPKRQHSQTIEEEAIYYEKDFDEYIFNNWNDFIKSERDAYSRWTPLIEVAVKDLGMEKDNKVMWRVNGRTAKYVIEAMHKHETEDIYDRLPEGILLLRATLPKEWDDYRALTGEIFQQKGKGRLKSIKQTTHMLHWDKPEVVISEIRKNW